VQSPGADVLGDPASHDVMMEYISGIIERFGNDPRILAWDLFNEPDNPNLGTYADLEPAVKAEMAALLLRKAFGWARGVKPSQPLTAGVWRGRVSGEDVTAINRLMLDESDVVSFHSYLGPGAVARRVEELRVYGRPVLLTEFMSRSSGSTFEAILPLAREQRVGVFCWGLVAGQTQTIFPWDSWIRDCSDETEPWFHDVLRPDGKPYKEDEVALIRRLTLEHPA
jgi:hypothetical protein